MKITGRHLRRLIKKEVSMLLNESTPGDGRLDPDEAEKLKLYVDDAIVDAQDEPYPKHFYSYEEGLDLLSTMEDVNQKHAKLWKKRLDDLNSWGDHSGVSRSVRSILYDLEDYEMIDDVDDYQPGFLEEESEPDEFRHVIDYLKTHDPPGAGVRYSPEKRMLQVRTYLTDQSGETEEVWELIEPTMQAARDWLGY